MRDMWSDKAKEAASRIQQRLDGILQESGAIKLSCGQNYSGKVFQEPDGRYSIDISSWGVHHGKQFYGDTIESVEQQAFEAYDLAPLEVK